MFKVIDTLRSDLNKAGGELVDILVDNANGKKKRVCDIVDSARSFIRNDGASQNVDYSKYENQLLYLLRYLPAYEREYRRMYSKLLEDLKYREGSLKRLQVVSIGCGNGVDYRSLIEAATYELGGDCAVDYHGIDYTDWSRTDFEFRSADVVESPHGSATGNPRWVDEHAELPLTDVDSTASSYHLADAGALLKREARAGRFRPDIIVLPKSILDIRGAKGAWEELLEAFRNIEGDRFYLAISRPQAALSTPMFDPCPSQMDAENLREVVQELLDAIQEGGRYAAPNGSRVVAEQPLEEEEATDEERSASFYWDDMKASYLHRDNEDDRFPLKTGVFTSSPRGNRFDPMTLPSELHKFCPCWEEPEESEPANNGPHPRLACGCGQGNYYEGSWECGEVDRACMMKKDYPAYVIYRFESTALSEHTQSRREANLAYREYWRCKDEDKDKAPRLPGITVVLENIAQRYADAGKRFIKCSAHEANEKLVEAGLLVRDGKTNNTHVTEKGERLGLHEDSGTNAKGSYTMARYTREAEDVVEQILLGTFQDS